LLISASSVCAAMTLRGETMSVVWGRRARMQVRVGCRIDAGGP
jgi:hypothetical protein